MFLCYPILTNMCACVVLFVARCKQMPKAPRNGMVIAPKTEHGMRARFKCKDGYILRGGNITKCLFGNWTGVQPYCQEGEPSFISTLSPHTFQFLLAAY